MFEGKQRFFSYLLKSLVDESLDETTFADATVADDDDRHLRLARQLHVGHLRGLLPDPRTGLTKESASEKTSLRSKNFGQFFCLLRFSSKFFVDFFI